MMDQAQWNAIIAGMPQPHLLQTWEWGEVKSQFGWQAHHRVWRDGERVVAAALVLERTINLGGMAARLRMHYTPKGPLLVDWADVALRKRVLGDLADFARQRGAFLLKIDPEVPVGIGLPVGKGVPGDADAQELLASQVLIAELKQGGWRFSDEQVQFRNTVMIDLTPDEETLLMAMKSKTRYNVRLAGRRGVTVRQGNEADLEMLYAMYAETAVRDGFAIRGKDYYLALWRTFLDAGILVPLVAELEGQALAGLMLFVFGGASWYLHGMSTEAHRNLMPTYLLQWEAMRIAKARGCQLYDLWGLSLIHI